MKGNSTGIGVCVRLKEILARGLSRVLFSWCWIGNRGDERPVGGHAGLMTGEYSRERKVSDGALSAEAFVGDAVAPSEGRSLHHRRRRGDEDSVLGAASSTSSSSTAIHSVNVS